MDRGHCRRRSGDRTIGRRGRRRPDAANPETFIAMLEAVDSDLDHVTHINIFLKHISDFEAMNAAYVEIMEIADRQARRFQCRTFPSPAHC
jgi:hypothetical protein